MDVIQTRQCAVTKNVHKQLGKGINYREIENKFGVVASIACEKHLFRLVPMPGHGARVLPLELMPVPGHGTQIRARAPTNGYVPDSTEILIALTMNFTLREGG